MINSVRVVSLNIILYENNIVSDQLNLIKLMSENYFNLVYKTIDKCRVCSLICGETKRRTYRFNRLPGTHFPGYNPEGKDEFNVTPLSIK